MEHTKAYQEFKKNGNTKFVRYSEGAEMYHMSVSKFMQMAKYIHEYVKNKEYMIVGTERRHGFSQNDVDRQWHQIVDKIRKKQVDGVIVANMSVITDNLIDAFIKIAQVQDAGGIIVTVDDGRLAMQLRGF